MQQNNSTSFLNSPTVMSVILACSSIAANRGDGRILSGTAAKDRETEGKERDTRRSSKNVCSKLNQFEIAPDGISNILYSPMMVTEPVLTASPSRLVALHMYVPLSSA